MISFYTERKKLGDQVFEILRDRIVYLQYPPGTHLTEPELCKELKVSRTPFREALRKLQDMNLIHIIPRYGTYVSNIEIHEIRCAFEVKRKLEALVGALAALRITPDNLNILKHLIVRAEKSHSENWYKELISIDSQFHETVRLSTQNPILSEIVTNIHYRCARMWISTLSKVIPKEDIIIQLKSIYEALVSRDEEKAAAFLESRKYAAYKGATIEFRKEEGITYDKESNVLYMAMSTLDKSMEDNYKGNETVNHIRLEKNRCGAVYKIKLDKNYSATHMDALVVGMPLKKGDRYADEWGCHPDTIANPDNITYIGHHLLLINEDTQQHVNNMSWAYNTQTGVLTRIASLPIGAEVTGVDTAVIDDKGILLINIQHPFKDNPKAADGSTPNSALIENANDEQLKASIGYIDGIPADIF